MNWDRLRIFLTVARSGQILAAARQLGINHATVGRHLTALETDLKTKLFARQQNGCVLTAAGAALLATVEKVEAEILRADAAMPDRGSTMEGTVRIGAPEGFGTYFLPAVLGRLVERHPDLVIQLIPQPRSFSLARREADVVVTVDRPEHGRLIVRKLTNYTLSLYASGEYLDRTGPITRALDLGGRVLITDVDDVVYSRALGYAAALDGLTRCRIECGGLAAQLEAVRSGTGFGILHDIVAARYPELCRILPEWHFTRTYWLMSHPDTHDVARVATVRRFIVDQVRTMAAAFVQA